MSDKKVFKCDLCLCPKCINYDNCTSCLFCTTKPVEKDENGVICDDYINKENSNIEIN